jgi:predicted GH43/DUF377 family glycosyl hydrolase
MSDADKSYFDKKFFGSGFFDWQFSTKSHEERWKENCYNEEKYWGGFSREPFDAESYKLPDWAIGPFTKHKGNPIFAPNPKGWDCGHFGGGVHNGSVLIKEGRFYYVYRGEFPLKPEDMAREDIDYCCDVGTAVSDDGVLFKRIENGGGALRPGGSEKYSFEDINVVSHRGRYYMFLNRWDWANIENPQVSGVFIAVSDDLISWEKIGLAFPEAKRIHRNGCVLQNPQNEAVKVNGRFVMYINNGLMGFSDDLIHWESAENPHSWPGGECSVALTDYRKNDGDSILLMTGGPHTGHFYAAGEVLFNKADVMKPLEWLPRPILCAEEKYPWEAGFSADGGKPVSYWRDTVFFTGITFHDDKWLVYYGGSEYYTCLATAPYKG